MLRMLSVQGGKVLHQNGEVTLWLATKILLYTKIIRIKSNAFLQHEVKCKCIQCVYKVQNNCKINCKLGEGKEDYGMDYVCTSVMRVYHSDLVSHARALRKRRKLCLPFRMVEFLGLGSGPLCVFEM